MFYILFLLYFHCVLVLGNLLIDPFVYELISIELLPNNSRIIHLKRDLTAVQFNY